MGEDVGGGGGPGGTCTTPEEEDTAWGVDRMGWASLATPLLVVAVLVLVVPHFRPRMQK